MIIALLGIGTGLTLYLPDNTDVTVQATTTHPIIYREDTLDKPININFLKYSQHVLVDENAEEPLIGIQLGLYSTLKSAKLGAKNSAIHGLSISLTPTIFKAQDTERQWYILGLGPFLSREELNRYQKLLKEQRIYGQSINWSLPPLEK